MISMNKIFPNKKISNALQIEMVSKIPSQYKDWAKTNNFHAQSGDVLITPDNKVLVGKGDFDNPFYFASICEKLPHGDYIAPNIKQVQNLVIGWALANYTFDTYKKTNSTIKKLIVPNSVDKKSAIHMAMGIFLARDLINAPANHMTPADIEDTAVKMAKQFKAKSKVHKGKILEKSYPLIHAVGRASSNKPRLIELNWGNDKHPHLHLIGKGISFDSGGLDIKTADGMLTMKKDMGGAANILGLAYVIMANKLPVKLKVLIPSAENMISDNSYRPMDILSSRSGQTIEVGHTDAEGRLVLADAFTYAGEAKDIADLTIDMATLTGYARVATGADLPAFFCNDDKIADSYYQAGIKTHDPVWRLPLHEPYEKLLDTPNADISSTGSTPLGGAILASLFLQRFINPKTKWIHVDLGAYNNIKSAGRPVGGEAMGIRALWELLHNRYK